MKNGGFRRILLLPLLGLLVVACAAPTPVLRSNKHLQLNGREAAQQDNLTTRMSNKLEDGGLRVTIRLASSDDTIAPFDDVTADALCIKQPPRAASDAQPPPPSSHVSFYRELFWRLSDLSFISMSVGGPDSLRP